MFNHHLTAFVSAVDCGSLTKAAEKLHLTPTAVMKQINSLESHIGVKLIERTSQGVRLTPAGEAIYKDATFLFDFSRRSIENAKQIANVQDKTFRVGISLLNPAKPFMDLWYKVSNQFPDYKLHLVPFEDDHEGILAEIEQLGRKFDFLLGVCDSKRWLDRCHMLPLGRYKKTCAVSRDHPLATKQRLELSDLYGRTLMMVKEGDSYTNDRLRHDLKTNHPAIRIEDTAHFYDMSVFNRCAETDNVLLLMECWEDVHPGLVSIPVNWDYSLPYGLLYPLHPTEDVTRFVHAVKTCI